jgi:putative FmdB family regulatory protein
MPTYVYYCEACDNQFEAFQKFSDDPLHICPKGHEGVRRVFTPAGIIFKGSGWYIKDSKSESSNGQRSKSSTDKASDSSSDASSVSKGGTSSEGTSSESSPAKSESAGTATSGQSDAS